MTQDREKISGHDKDRPPEQDKEKPAEGQDAPVVQRERDTLPLEGE